LSEARQIIRHADPELKKLIGESRLWPAQLAEAREIIQHADLVDGMRSGKYRPSPAAKGGDSPSYYRLQEARQITRHADLADGVRSGVMPLRTACGDLDKAARTDRAAASAGRLCACSIFSGLSEESGLLRVYGARSAFVAGLGIAPRTIAANHFEVSLAADNPIAIGQPGPGAVVYGLMRVQPSPRLCDRVGYR
jgi:hypothetical protein